MTYRDSAYEIAAGRAEAHAMAPSSESLLKAAQEACAAYRNAVARSNAARKAVAEAQLEEQRAENARRVAMDALAHALQDGR